MYSKLTKTSQQVHRTWIPLVYTENTTTTSIQFAGTVVSQLQATDVDFGDVLTFSIEAPATTPFRVENNSIVTSQQLDFETQSFYFFDVVVTDAGNLTDVQVQCE